MHFEFRAVRQQHRNSGKVLPLSLTILLLHLLPTLLLLPSATHGYAQEFVASDPGNLMEMEEWDPSEDPKAPKGTVWHNDSYLYMPAPPGRSPKCARGGMTYCSSIPTYPSEVIEKLLIRWKYDLSTVFSSENRDTLTSGIARNISAKSSTESPRTSYGPPPKRTYGPPRATDVPMRGYGAPFVSSQTFDQSQFRPVRGQSSRPIGYGAGVTSSAGLSNQGGPSLVHTVPSTQQRPPPAQPYAGYRSSNSANSWAYSFSVPSSRQKRQADSIGQLCKTVDQFVTPQAGLNNEGQWRFLINMNELDEQYTQLVRSQRCLSSECSGLCTIPAGLTATCQQQYVQKKLVGLNPSGGEMYTDLYWIPHCCVCQIS